MNRLEIAIEVMKHSLQDSEVVDYEAFAKYCFDIAEAMLAEEAKRKGNESKPKEDSGGWIEWDGGKCPVSAYTNVRVITITGDVEEGYAHVFCWGKIGSPGYIVAYRVIK